MLDQPNEELWWMRPDGTPEMTTAPRSAHPPTMWWPAVKQALGERDACDVRVAQPPLSITAKVLRSCPPRRDEDPRILVRLRVLPVLEGERITPRQREVAEFAAVGATVGEIAAQLGISLNTVRTHLKGVYRTLGVASRVELAYAMGHLTGPSDGAHAGAPA
jgi:DNA-binding NarL/FixJ family response regulator